MTMPAERSGPTRKISRPVQTKAAKPARERERLVLVRRRGRPVAFKMRPALRRQLPDTGPWSLDETAAEQRLQAVGIAQPGMMQGVEAPLMDRCEAPRAERVLDEPILDVRDWRFA